MIFRATTWNRRRSASSALAVGLVLGGFCPGFSAATAAGDGGFAAQVAQTEQMLFGHGENGPLESRVRALEESVFGKSTKGPLDKRLSKINKTLGLGLRHNPSKGGVDPVSTTLYAPAAPATPIAPATPAAPATPIAPGASRTAESASSAPPAPPLRQEAQAPSLSSSPSVSNAQLAPASASAPEVNQSQANASAEQIMNEPAAKLTSASQKETIDSPSRVEEKRTEAKPQLGTKPQTAAAPKVVAGKTAHTAASTAMLKPPMKAIMAEPPVAPQRSRGTVAVAPSIKSSLDIKRMLQAGTQKFSEQKTEEAEGIFRQVLLRDPCNVDALYNLGAIDEQRGEYLSALGNFKLALSIKENDRDLKDAVASVEAKIAQSHSRNSKGPLIGSAFRSDLLQNPQLSAQQPRMAPPGSATPPNWPVLSVNQMQPPTVTASGNPPGNHGVVGSILRHAPLFLPEPIHCPVCSMLGNIKF